jgi:hypothetical protein
MLDFLANERERVLVFTLRNLDEEKILSAALNLRMTNM